jgi:excisionase family DNA binding protein
MHRAASPNPIPVRQVEIVPKWHTVAEVAAMLGYGLTKTKMLVISGELRSLKDGRSRRVLPQWVDEYVARRAAEAEEAWG